MPEQNQIDNSLENTVALVTGASRGIGKAIAANLMRLGAKVIITGRDKETLDTAVRELDPSKQNIQALVADASDPDVAAEVVKKSQDRFGPINLLVNNAGIGREEGSPGDWDLDTFWTTIDVNLKGPIAYCHQVLQSMLESNSGCIINVSSYAAVRPCSWGIAYAASKAGLARFSDSLAVAVSDSNVRVFTISPGLVATDMTAKLPFAENIPSDQWNSIDQAPELVARLAGEKYACLSGRFIHVNDDLEALLADTKRIRSENLYQLRLQTIGGPLD